jgi:hypothetical protein
MTTFKLVSWFFAVALVSGPSAVFAQTSDGDQAEDPSDACIAADTASGAFENMTGLPTSTKSAYEMAFETVTKVPATVSTLVENCAKKAGLSEAISEAFGLGVSTFLDSSSIATDEQEGSPYQMQERAQQAQEAAHAYQFWLAHQAELNQSYSQWLRTLKPLPTGPQILPCTQYCNK